MASNFGKSLGKNAIAAFKRFATDNSEIEKLQSNVEAALAPILRSAIANGTLITGVSLSTGKVNQVEHGLTRAYNGYIIVDQNTNANVWTANSDLPQRFINLNCSANVRVSIWVF
jgi:hypothetical protein